MQCKMQSVCHWSFARACVYFALDNVVYRILMMQFFFLRAWLPQLAKHYSPTGYNRVKSLLLAFYTYKGTSIVSRSFLRFIFFIFFLFFTQKRLLQFVSAFWLYFVCSLINALARQRRGIIKERPDGIERFCWTDSLHFFLSFPFTFLVIYIYVYPPTYVFSCVPQCDVWFVFFVRIRRGK